MQKRELRQIEELGKVKLYDILIDTIQFAVTGFFLLDLLSIDIGPGLQSRWCWDAGVFAGELIWGIMSSDKTSCSVLLIL